LDTIGAAASIGAITWRMRFSGRLHARSQAAVLPTVRDISGGSVQHPRRYRAFVSYSHADERWARWLQRALERYRVPKTLRKAQPGLPERLFPIFRDRDELASSTDLSESIQAAMVDSEAMVVVCSPNAAKSQWVNREVERFRQLRPGARILCLLVGGSPTAGAADCAFPPALLQGDDGGPLREPLAADVTVGGDGKRNAMLKIAAGLLGVGIDELKRRYAQWRARVWATVAAGSALIALVTIGLAIAAMLARQESEIRRKQGEKLIGFMLGDLRSKLEPIGKLDVLDAVGDQAMDYFAALGKRGTPQELLDRAKTLRQIGDVRFHQGHLDGALAAFRQSLAEARALHEENPQDNEYLFELGQAEFWVGYVAWQRNDLGQAHASMENYMRDSQQLKDRAPDKAAYRMELAYAHNNLGSVARAQGHAREALQEFRKAATISEAELASNPDDAAAISDLSDIWSWISSTQQDLGDLEESKRAAARAADLIRSVHARGKDARASAKYADYLLVLSDAELRLGQVADASRDIESARAIYRTLLAKDPSNAFWRQNALAADYYAVAASTPDTWTAQARESLDATAAALRALADKDPSNKRTLKRIAIVERLEALAALAQDGKAALALQSAQHAQEIMKNLAAGPHPPTDVRMLSAQIEETLGAAVFANGDKAGAERIWNSALAALDAEPKGDLVAVAIRRLLAVDLGQTQLAAELSQRLEKAGFHDPRFEAYGGKRH
jgi:tetratricopeptide (TPR) repeat protein